MKRIAAELASDLPGGGAPQVIAAIPYATEFNRSSLRQLARGQIDLIWHESFYPISDCRAVLPRIKKHCEAARYTLTDDLQSLGTSIGEAVESDENVRRYLRTAPNTISLIRNQIFQHHKSPSDVIRLQADEYWPHGAMVGKYDGYTMLPNIIRRWPAGGHANPHIDQREIQLLDAYRLVMRIGINVYIETPEEGSGGEIEFWHKFTDEKTYVASKRQDYGLDRDTLGQPLCVIHPGQGDLLMFDAARVHGVRRVARGSRVTAACFLGVRSETDPLVVFA